MNGFLAVSAPGTADGPHPGAVACLPDAASARTFTGDGGWLAATGTGPADLLDTAPSRFTGLLMNGARTRTADVTVPEVARLLGGDSGGDSGGDCDADGLTALLPPFAAVHRAGPHAPIVLAADWLGFRHVYWWQGDGVAAVSTSARALAVLAGRGYDPDALGVQSLLGWQLGTATVFRGVVKLAAGCLAVLQDGRVRVRRYAPERLDTGERPPVAQTVSEMAAVLRDWQVRYLADHPDSVLQLTGGYDSRMLLAAVPGPARRGLAALTLDTHGGRDAAIAARLSTRWGLDHHVHWLDDRPPPTPAQAHRLAVDAAAGLECMASPLALAPLLLAEGELDQGRRLSGLGGEVARGFYYGGEPATATTSAAAVERLARWRLFANEAVTADALEPDFAAAARTAALAALTGVFTGYADRWLSATDEFFLFERTQRWGGAHGTVAATARTFVNPMFDRRFLALTLAADPDDKRHTRLYGRLMNELDPRLARIPLDSGATPARLGTGGPVGVLAGAALTGRKAVRKVRQRLTGGRRPQLGAAGLAGLVVAHWRAEPGTVAPLRGSGILRDSWLDEVLDGRREAPPTTVAFLVNLLVAAQATTPAGALRA